MFSSPSEFWGSTLPYNLTLCVTGQGQKPEELILQDDRRGLRLGQNGGGENLR